jgi:hypothetical protein
MRFQYDLYVLFDESKSEMEAADVAREVAFDDLGDGLVKGIAGSDLHEDGFVLVSTLYIDVGMFDEFHDSPGLVVPVGVHKELESRLDSYPDAALQLVRDGWLA